MEHLQPELLPHASKWQSLGEALSLDEDRLDEIYTNNETDEACLQEMLELYLARPDPGPQLGGDPRSCQNDCRRTELVN